jgi:hypothetical protein
MPTDHGVRSRVFFGLLLVTLVGLFGVTGMAVAARPAKTAEAMQMGSFHPPKSANGFLVQGLISTRKSRYGMMLLTPKRPHSAVTPPDPMYAYLFRKPLRSSVNFWPMVAQTVLRGPMLKRGALRRFCTLVQRDAPDLMPRECSR